MRAFALCALLLLMGCQSLLGAEPTPVPGAAATITRSVRTPIPTPVRAPSVEPAASAGPSPAATRVSASPVARASAEQDVANVEHAFDQTVSSADLPGIENFLLDRVSVSTPAGGQVLDRADAATWLREHASGSLSVARVDASTQTQTIEVQTEGWPQKDPIEAGKVTFSMRRYGANGRLDEENGDWKIDVMTAE